MSAGCQACDGGWPPHDDRIADLDVSTAYLHADQFFPGWSVLVLKRHATELFDLAAAERAILMDEVACVARGLATVFRARKMNYALFGNVLPHLHWHVIPRGADDPAPRDSVWSIPHERVALGPDARRARVAAIRAKLDAR